MLRLEYGRIGVIYGLVGGLIGSVILGILAYLTPVPVSGGDLTLVPFFTSALFSLGVPIQIAMNYGWIFNLIAGLAIGAIFGALVSFITGLKIQSFAKGFEMGVLAGIATFGLFFVTVLAPFVPELFDSFNPLLFEILGAHIIFGIVMGTIMALGMTKNKTAVQDATKISEDDRLVTLA